MTCLDICGREYITCMYYVLYLHDLKQDTQLCGVVYVVFVCVAFHTYERHFKKTSNYRCLIGKNHAFPGKNVRNPGGVVPM